MMTRIQQSKALCAGILLLAAISTGCSQANSGKQGAATPSSQPVQTTASSPAQEPATRVVETSLGQAEIPAHPTRIALTYHDDIDHLMALGIKPAAVPTYDRPGNVDGFFPYLAEDLKGVQKLGTAISMEPIVAADPDLIIAGYHFKDKMDELNKIAPSFYLEWKADWRETHMELGKALGKEAEAQKNVDEFNSLVKQAKEKLQTALGDQTVVFIRVLQKEIRLHGTIDQVPGFILYNQLGLKPSPEVPTDTWGKPISKEAFALMKTDHIFLSVNDTDEAKAVAKEFMESPLYAEIPAIKNGNVHMVQGFPWERGGPIAFKDGIRQVLEALVP